MDSNSEREVQISPPLACKLMLVLMSLLVLAFTVIIPILLLPAAPFVIMTGAIALFALLSCLCKMKLVVKVNLMDLIFPG